MPLVNIEHGCQNEVKGEMDNQQKKALKENSKIFLAKNITTVFLGQKNSAPEILLDATKGWGKVPTRIG